MATETELGPYRVLRELGKGAVGRVVAALDPRTGKQYAIKTLLRGADVSQRALLDEAAVVVQLSHPSIVSLVDVGRDADGALFLVMDLVHGQSLKEWLGEAPEPEDVFRVFDQMLDALAAAHAQGVVHGDLKPANVLVERDGRVKITDFGIARVLDPVRRRDERPVAGTPAYMAPEQIFDPDDIGPATDLYAIGVMLRQVLGQADASRRKSLEEVIIAKLNAAPPFRPREGLEAPAELGALVDALVDPDPRKRPRFATHVRRALANIAPRTAGPRARAPTVMDTTVMDRTHAAATGASSSGALSDTLLPDSAAPEVLLRRLRPLPLVARREELELLHGLGREVSEGDGTRALLFVGRAGDGKSRLARHGYAEVERDGLMVGAAASFDELGQNASVDLRACLRRLLGTPRVASTVDETLESRWSWLEGSISPSDARALHAFLVPDAGPLDSKNIAALAAVAFEAAARVRPIYLWLDDVAWSRDGAKALVLALLASKARVLVVGTIRSGTAEHPATRAWLDDVERSRGAVVHHVPPLTPGERAKLMEEAGLAREHARALASQLDQPTVVVLEAVRGWIDDGHLVKDDDEYHPAPSVTIDALARSAPDALGRRVGALLGSFGPDAPRALRALLHAALLGAVFEEHALRECCKDPMDDVLDRALLVGILRVQQAGVYRFEHQLYVEHLLGRLATLSDRADIQRRTARVIETLYSGLRPDITSSPRLFREAGDIVAAYQSADRLVRTLSISHMFAEADEIIAEIARWADADGPSHPAGEGHYLLARGRRAYHELDHARAIESLTRARDAFTRAGNTEMADEAARTLATAYFFADQPRRMEEIVLEILPRVKNATSHAMIHHHLCEIAQLRCDIVKAIAHERTALEIAPDDVVVLGTLATLLFVHGDFDEATQLTDVYKARLSGSTRRDLVIYTTSLDSVASSLRGDFDAAVRSVNEWIHASEELGDTWQLTCARVFRALSAAAIEPIEIAEQHVAAAMAAYRAVPQDEIQTWWAIRATESLLRGRGRAPLADELGAMLTARQAKLDL
jgi:serine/threonine protein kinase